MDPFSLDHIFPIPGRARTGVRSQPGRPAPPPSGRRQHGPLFSRPVLPVPMDGQLRSFQHHLPRPGQFLTPLASSSAFFFFFPSLELSKNREADPAASWLAALCAVLDTTAT